MDSQLKVSRAMADLAFAHPFFGSVGLTLGAFKDESIPTAATNGKRIFWNPEFIDECEEEEVKGIIAHECMHAILQHCQPHPGKDMRLCNVAMDYVINNSLTKDANFKLPEGGIIDELNEFVGMTWQQVYSILEDVKDKFEKSQEDGSGDPFDKDGAADKNGMSKARQKELGEKISDLCQQEDIEHILDNSDLSPDEREELKRQLEQLTVRAAEAAKSAGRPGSVPGSIQELIEEIRESKVDWRDYLRENLASRFPDDYTFKRPNRKFFSAYNMYLPGMEGTQIGHLAVHLDTSGSVSKSELVDYLSELNALKEEFNIQEVSIFYTDFAVANVETFGPGEPIEKLNAAGGGGTSFVPTFDYIKENDMLVDQMLVFSDMEVWDSCFPEEEPDFPVLFLSTRDDYNVPFGECIRINQKAA